METQETSKILQFQPWTSAVDVPFWYQFSKKKLDEYRLSDKPVPIHAYYGTGYHPSVPSHFNINMDAFLSQFSPPSFHFSVPGKMFNTNTIEQFKKLDKKAISDDIGRQIWDDINSGAALEDPSLLNRFGIVTFSDLKKYHYHFWFSFPVILGTGQTTLLESRLLSSVFNEEQISQLQSGLEPLRQKNNPFFLIKTEKNSSKIQVASLKDHISILGHNPGEGGGGDSLYVGIMDPGNQDGILGWPLRNLLPLLYTKFGLKTVQILSYKYSRDDSAKLTPSRVFTIQIGDYTVPSGSYPSFLAAWEKNHKGEARPKFVNLSSTMDPKQLAESAVELNLKLMRWRVLPNLDLERVFKTKCLILGAGTLGCNIARSLLSWGVRNITFVDSGKVSFSNPVRQTLYTFEDSKEGKEKAIAAAEMLKKIYPNINSRGFTMLIPMPGHPVEDKNEKEVNDIVQQLDQLIEEHDFVYLGLDSREARWLPTLLAANRGKAVLNVALGFDTYVVMRHGSPTYEESTSQSTPCDDTLGCYFCNDVMAPQDSLTDRTLDQQCTVTRPGLSFMASSIAVEMMVSILHHPKGIKAPPESRTELGTKGSTELGIIPHQIRGFLSNFQNVPMVGYQYNRCVACSSYVISHYRKSPKEFCLSVFNKPIVLEDITGITQMKQEQDKSDISWDVEDDF